MRGDVDDQLEWHLRDRLSGGPATTVFHYGARGDLAGPKSLLCDWNGDGSDTPGVVYNEERLEWHLRMVNRGGHADVVFRYGLGDPEPWGPHDDPELDEPVVGDWNGDGGDTPGVVRADRGRMRWLLNHSLRGGHADQFFTYGRSSDPEAGRFAPDRPLTWR